jgi:hypothetical protein
MTQKTSETLANALGIKHEVEILPPIKQEVAVIEEPAAVGSVDQQEDYTLARSTFRQLITRGNDAIEGISDLAKESESPRAYEVMATLMKTVAETTKDLYDLQKKTKDLLTNSGSKKLDETNITVDKAVFVGTTAELIRKVKNNEDI